MGSTFAVVSVVAMFNETMSPADETDKLPTTVQLRGTDMEVLATMTAEVVASTPTGAETLGLLYR